MSSRFLRLLAIAGLAAGLGLGSSSTVLAQDAAAPAPSADAAGAPAAPLELSNKWRIEVSEGANNDGTLLFRVTPDKGTSTDVLVSIKKGRGENGIATDIKDAFKATLDGKIYKVETDDGEDVLVKRRKGPNFEVKFVESTLEGTRINIEKE